MSSRILDHVHQIKNKVEVLCKSTRIHALIVESAAGWGKTTSVDEALALAGVIGRRLGSYSTPLNLFTFLQQNSDKVVILDDVAGLFTDRSAMAILKAATWPSPGGRIVAWGSTTSRIETQEFEFLGKLIIVCNSFPSTADAKAVKSRSLTHFFNISPDLAKTLFHAAAKEKKWFENFDIAQNVAAFLCDRVTLNNLDQLSYRTLHLGYDLALHKPEEWMELLSSMIQVTVDDPKGIVRELSAQGLSVNDQVLEFERITGMKRRTYFKYKKNLGLAKNGCD